MSENDINRWQEAITPRHAAPQPWTLGNGGSWDMTQVQPISDEMLAELAERYRYMGTPWNCRSMPLSPEDREYMYLLYFCMQGLVARVRRAEAECQRPLVPVGVMKILAELHDAAILSEGQIATALGVDRVTCRTMLDETQQAVAHQWDADGERCTLCGAKDWMAGECPGPKGWNAEFLSKRLGRVCTKLGLSQPFGDKHEANAEVAGTTLAAVARAIDQLNARIAELDRQASDPVHWRAVLQDRQGEISPVPRIAGFQDLKSAEQFCAEKKDFQGWNYTIEPLFLRAPKATPEGWKLVPVVPTDEMIVLFAEQWYSERQTIDDPQLEGAWAAALSAAPSPEGENG